MLVQQKMEAQNLNIKRSQSDSLCVGSKIISPSPIRKPARISLNVAREIFDLPSSLDDLDNNNAMAGSFHTYMKAKFNSVRGDNDSNSEWGSDSWFSNSNHGDYDSPVKSVPCIQLGQEEAEEISSEMVPRVSNPIVHDARFIKIDQELFKVNFGAKIVARP